MTFSAFCEVVKTEYLYRMIFKNIFSPTNEEFITLTTQKVKFIRLQSGQLNVDGYTNQEPSAVLIVKRHNSVILKLTTLAPDCTTLSFDQATFY